MGKFFYRNTTKYNSGGKYFSSGGTLNPTDPPITSEERRNKMAELAKKWQTKLNVRNYGRDETSDRLEDRIGDDLQSSTYGTGDESHLIVYDRSKSRGHGWFGDFSNDPEINKRFMKQWETGEWGFDPTKSNVGMFVKLKDPSIYKGALPDGLADLAMRSSVNATDRYGLDTPVYTEPKVDYKDHVRRGFMPFGSEKFTKSSQEKIRNVVDEITGWEFDPSVMKDIASTEAQVDYEMASRINPKNYRRTADMSIGKAFLTGNIQEYKDYTGIASNKDEAFQMAHDELGAGTQFLYDPDGPFKGERRKRYTTDHYGQTTHKNTQSINEFFKNNYSKDVYDRYIKTWNKAGQPDIVFGRDDQDAFVGGQSWDAWGMSYTDHVNPSTGRMFLVDVKLEGNNIFKRKGDKWVSGTKDDLMNAILNETPHSLQQREMGTGKYMSTYVAELLQSGGDQGAMYDKHKTLEHHAHSHEYEVLSNYVLTGQERGDQLTYDERMKGMTQMAKNQQLKLNKNKQEIKNVVAGVTPFFNFSKLFETINKKSTVTEQNK